MRRARWYRESFPIFRFDVLELRLDYALDSTVFAMEMLQAAGQDQPRLLLPAAAIDPCDFLQERLLDKLLERAPLLGGSGFDFAEERPRNFECRFHEQLSPIFMGTVKKTPKSVLSAPSVIKEKIPVPAFFATPGKIFRRN